MLLDTRPLKETPLKDLHESFKTKLYIYLDECYKQNTVVDIKAIIVIEGRLHLVAMHQKYNIKISM